MKPKLILGAAGIIIIVAFIAIIAVLIPKIHIPINVTQSAVTKPGYYKITNISDGDTFTVNMDGREEKVRLIGVDTPETQKPNSPVECGGPEASDFAKHALAGQTVRLEADPINQNRDRYDRLLRYAYLADGTLFNKLLITEGYGTPYTSFPFQKIQEFIEAGLQAKATSKGVWAGVCKLEDQNGRYKTNPI